MGTIFVHSHPIRGKAHWNLNLTLLGPVWMQELGWLTGDKKCWLEQETTVLTMLAAASAPTPGSDPGVECLMLSASSGWLPSPGGSSAGPWWPCSWEPLPRSA